MIVVGWHCGTRGPCSIQVTVSNVSCVFCSLGEAARHEVARVLQDTDTLRNHCHIEGLAPCDGLFSVQSFRLLIWLATKLGLQGWACGLLINYFYLLRRRLLGLCG